MASSASLSSLLLFFLLLTLSNAANFNVVNQCPYTVWAAATPGGGKQLNPGQSWSFNVNPGTIRARVWGRTGCSFDSTGCSFDSTGHGHCQTGDCGGLLACQAYGTHPNTLAEYSLNQYMNLDFYDISLIEGFNVPMDFRSVNGNCHDIRCSADINKMCPGPLRTTGGCNNPCTGNCGPSDHSRFFKRNCPDAYSYPKDDQTSKCLFTCPSGSNYVVVFCP